MWRLFSGGARVSGSKAFRLVLAAALAGTVPFAVAQRGGSAEGARAGSGFVGHIGAGYAGHSFNGYSAPHFVSTFGPHSITGTPGANFVAPSGRHAPDYGSSWGIGHPTWQSGRGGDGNRGRDRDRDRDRDHDLDRYRSPYLGYGYGYPITNTWAVLPWEMGYADVSGAENSQNANPDNYEPAQQEYAPQEEYRLPYSVPDYAPPPPAAAAPVTSSTVLESEPALTLIFKDGHQQSIRNYALTADAVIVLDKAATGRQERIPLADLNLSATKQAAEAAGLDFAPPQ